MTDWFDEYLKEKQKNDVLKAETERLREALSDLLGVQNGPPLVTWTEEWNAAILKAEAALKGDE